jgi:hypothetical protein
LLLSKEANTAISGIIELNQATQPNLLVSDMYETFTTEFILQIIILMSCRYSTPA